MFKKKLKQNSFQEPGQSISRIPNESLYPSHASDEKITFKEQPCGKHRMDDEFIRDPYPSDVVFEAIRSLNAQMPIDRSVRKDLVRDARNVLTNDEKLPALESYSYPRGAMHAASVSVLSHFDADDSKDDKFIQVMTEAYRGTNRAALGAKSAVRKLRVHLLSSDSRGVRAVEFSSEKDYWGFIAAVKSTVAGQEVNFTCRCGVLSTGADDRQTADNRATPGKSRGAGGTIMTLLSGGGGSNDARTHTCIVKEGRLVVTEKSSFTSAGINMELADIKALAITADYELPKQLLLEVRFEAVGPKAAVADLSGIYVDLLIPDGTPGNSPTHKTSSGQINGSSSSQLSMGSAASSIPVTSLEALKLSAMIAEGGNQATRRICRVPISKEELLSGQTSVGARAVGVLSIGDSEGSKMLQGVKSHRFTILANELIPFESMLSKTSRAKSTEMTSKLKDKTQHRKDGSNRNISPHKGVLPWRHHQQQQQSSDTTTSAPLEYHGASGITLFSADRPVHSQDEPELLFEQPLNVDLQVLLPEKQLGDDKGALVVTISGAQRLPGMGKKGVAPSAYCTVMAVTETMTQISHKSLGELKTEVVRGVHGPDWLKRFELPLEFCPGVAGLLVKVYDSAAGVLRHRVIGQVFVPVGCFIDQAEAHLILPLESSDSRTSGTLSDLGELHLSTILLTSRAAPNDVTSKSLMHRSSSMSPITGPSSGATARLTYTLRPVTALGFWWPWRILSSAPINDTDDDADDDHGLCGLALCGHSALLLKMPVNLADASPAVEPEATLLATCKEVQMPSTSSSSTSQHALVTIPWSQLNYCTEVSDSALLVSFNLQRPPPSAPSSASVEVLIAPCPSACLHRAFTHRLDMWAVRDELRAVVAAASASADSPSPLLATFTPKLITSFQYGTPDKQAATGLTSTGTGPGAAVGSPRPAVPSNPQPARVAAGSRLRAALSQDDDAYSQPSLSLSIDPRASSSSSALHSNEHRRKHKTQVVLAMARAVSATLEVLTSEIFGDDCGAAPSSSSSSASPSASQERVCRTPSPASASIVRSESTRKAVGRLSISGSIHSTAVDAVDDVKKKTCVSVRGYCNQSSSLIDSREEEPVAGGLEASLSLRDREGEWSWARRLRALNRRIRGTVYFAVLMHVCSTLEEAPEFAVERVHEMIDRDVEDVQKAFSSQDAVSVAFIAGEDSDKDEEEDDVDVEVEEGKRRERGMNGGKRDVDTDAAVNSFKNVLRKRFDSIRDVAEIRVRDFVLCSFTHWKDSRPRLHRTSSGIITLADRITELSASTAAVCIAEVVAGYLNALRMLLFPFVSSKSAFLRVRGLEAKTFLLRFVIERNEALHYAVQRMVSPISWVFEPKLRLMAPQRVRELLLWYNTALVGETRTWLAKTVRNAVAVKLSSSTPWDVEMVGDKWISHLPETLAIQMNVFAELCVSTKPAGSSSVSPAPTEGSSAGTQAKREDHVSAPPASDTNEEARLCLLHVNDQIVSAISSSWLLLAEEFTRALQSRHWDQIPPPPPPSHTPPAGTTSFGLGTMSRDDVMAQHLTFLIAMANDCYRISNTHAHALKDIETFAVSPVEVAGKISNTFHEVGYRAVQLIARIAFVDVQESLLEFDSLWASPARHVVRKITTKLSHLFDGLRGRIEDSFFVLTVNFCADTCAMRILLMLKNRAVKNMPFSVADVSRLELDVALLSKCFSDAKALAASDKLVASLLSKQLSLLVECCDLLRLNIDDPAYLPLMRGVISRYIGQGAEFVDAAGAYLRVLVGVLHPSASAASQALVTRVNDEFESRKAFVSPSGTGQSNKLAIARLPGSENSDDLIYRAFSVRDEPRPVETHGSSSRPSSLRLPSMSLRGGSAVKNLRERAADMGMLGLSTTSVRKKNDEEATQVMRTLGLEDDGKDENDVKARVTLLRAGLISEGSDRWRTSMRIRTDGSDEDEDIRRGSCRDNASEMESAMSMSVLGGNGADQSFEVIDDPCMLVVSAIQVKGIVSSTMFGTANPYVAITLGNHRQKTKVKWNKTEADWRETTLSFRTSRSRLEINRLNVCVFDKERIRRKRLLGTVTVRLAGVDLSKIEGWFALEGGSTGSCGEVHLCIEAFS